MDRHGLGIVLVLISKIWNIIVKAFFARQDFLLKQLVLPINWFWPIH